MGVGEGPSLLNRAPPPLAPRFPCPPPRALLTPCPLPCLTLFFPPVPSSRWVTVCFYDADIVLIAFIVTMTVFITLTVFTIQTRIDFIGAGP